MKIKMLHGYEVWSDGSIRNKNSCSFKVPWKTPKGYTRSGFYYNKKLHGWLWHRFVAEAFLGECPQGWEVNHINGVRDDNRLCNLEYLTKSQNNQLSYDSGRRNVGGTKNANCKYTEQQIHLVCKMLQQGVYSRDRDIAESVGISLSSVRNIKYRKQWKHITSEYNY